MYDIRQTKLYKDNRGKLSGVNFNPIKYTFQGQFIGYGLDIVSETMSIKIESKKNGYFLVTVDKKTPEFFETSHVKTIKEVQRIISKHVLLNFIY